MRSEISKQEYLIAEGLTHLMRFHQDKANEYIEAVQALFGTDEYLGDMAFDKVSVEAWLKILKIKVNEE